MDELIVERKEEKRQALKEKLQSELKTIHDRKVPGVNNEPFLEGAFEQLTSNGIWEQVLGYLTNPSDVTSAYFACGTFARILEKRRMLLMLPKVLNVFKTKIDEAFEVEGQEIVNATYQNWNGLCLSSRGVSKAWKETIDFHFNTVKDDWLLTTDDWTDVDDPRLNVTGLGGESLDQITSSLISRGLTRSPIRDVHVIFSDRIPAPFYGKLMKYLQAHGSSIRFLYFQYDNPGSIAIGTYYKMFCEMLKYMENLKALDIVFQDEEEVPQLGGPQLFQLEDIQLGLNEHPLPSSLASLGHFSCSQWETNELLVSQILRKCANLRSVNFKFSAPFHIETTEALMQLRLEQFSGLPSIITSNRARWPLKILKIYAGMNASVLFPGINRFHETLQELHIWDIGDVPLRIDTRDVHLELPHLKLFFISIAIGEGTFGFDDLLHIKSLRRMLKGKVKMQE